MSYKLEWKNGNTWTTISSGDEKNSDGSSWGPGITRVALSVTVTETASNITVKALAKVQTKNAYYNNPSSFWLHLTFNGNTTSSSFPSWGYQTYPDNTGAWKDMWYGPDQYTTTGWMQISQEDTFTYGFDNGQSFEITVTGYNNETVKMRITIDDIPTPTVTFTDKNLVNGILVTKKSSKVITVTKYPTYGNITYNFKIDNTSVQNNTSNQYTHKPTSNDDTHTYNYTIIVTAPNGSTKQLTGNATFVTYTAPSITETIARRDPDAQGKNAFLSITFIPPKVAGNYQNTECTYSIPKLNLSNVSLGSGYATPTILSTTITGNRFNTTDSYKVIFQLKNNNLTDLPQSSIIITIAGSGIIDTIYESGRYGIAFGAVATAGYMDTGLDLGSNIKKLISNFSYPVGSIFTTTSSDFNTKAKVEAYFGGEWVQITDKFLLAAGTTYAAGSTGGEATHTLTIDEMPSHQHSFMSPGASVSSGSSYNRPHNKDLPNEWSSGDTYQTTKRGGDGAHNNMPPYVTVYMWQRTQLAD